MKNLIGFILSGVVIFVIGFYFVTVIAHHRNAQDAVADLWEEFRSNVEDCPSPYEWSSAGECLDSNRQLRSVSRSSEAIILERDKRLRKLGYCRAFGSWWESKMSFETPTASDTVFYKKCW